MDTLNNPFVQAHDPDLVDKVREIISGKKSMRTEEEESAYQKFFQKALKKFGVNSPSELSGKKKKEFFEYVDKNWKGKDEQKVDGRTKAYRSTVKRIEARRAKSKELTEKE